MTTPSFPEDLLEEATRIVDAVFETHDCEYDYGNGLIVRCSSCGQMGLSQNHVSETIAHALLTAFADPLRAEGWDSGKHSEHTPSCRWSNAPDCICVTPYQPETDELRQKGVTND